jgi:adenine-specific DNA-methyltransferase
MLTPKQLDLRQSVTVDQLLPLADELRLKAAAALDQERRSAMGQFLTPSSVAQLMASMFNGFCGTVRLLDAGSGSGSLTAAAIAAMLAQDDLPDSVEIVAYEVEPALVPFLRETLDACGVACQSAGVAFTAQIELTDFLDATAQRVASNVPPEFTAAILNPPYRKIRTNSDERARCRKMGLEVSNLYAAFVGATLYHLQVGAEIVAITPRSFANGPYFRAFREFLLSKVALQRIHVFDSRNTAFSDDAVLQENVIFHAERGASPPAEVEIAASAAPDAPIRSRRVPSGRVVYEHDPERFIHLIVDPEGDSVAKRMAELDHYLTNLEITVSTGPVVDFRATEHLRHMPEESTVPLLYPMHLGDGVIHWPRPERAKWNALALDETSYRLTVPRGDYVLVKRFTAKEERRRVVAAVLEAKSCVTERVGLENHLNYFHENGRGLPLDLARGLALYLNSSLVDTYFRQFSGHTQVNAADLRNMPYPPRERLEAAGKSVGATLGDQIEVDALAERLLF